MMAFEILKNRREELALTPDFVAEAIGVSTPAYYELEEDEDEVFECISIAQVKRLCDCLGLTITDLLGDQMPALHLISDDGFRRIAESISKVASRRQTTPSDLADEIGWEVDECVRDPSSVWEHWNLVYLRDVLLWLGRQGEAVGSRAG